MQRLIFLRIAAVHNQRSERPVSALYVGHDATAKVLQAKGPNGRKVRIAACRDRIAQSPQTFRQVVNIRAAAYNPRVGREGGTGALRLSGKVRLATCSAMGLTDKGCVAPEKSSGSPMSRHVPS